MVVIQLCSGRRPGFFGWMTPSKIFRFLTCIAAFSRYQNLILSESDFDFITDDTATDMIASHIDSVHDEDPTRQLIRTAKVHSHGKFINGSVTSSHTTIESNTTLDYWDISNQRGIMKLQTLRFRRIGNMGKG